MLPQLRSLALLILFGVFAGPFIADAAAPPGLVFTDTSDIEISAEAASTTTEVEVGVEVCNTTDGAATVEFRLAGFDDAVHATFSDVALPNEAAIGVIQPDEAQIEAGACAQAVVTFKAASLPKPHSGELLVLAPGVGSARRAVSVTTKSPTALEPLSDLKLTGSFSATFGVRGAVDLDASAILLRHSGDVAPQIAAGTRIGVVASNDDSAEVWSTGASTTETPGVIRVPIEIRGASQQGSFNGVLDTDVAGSKDKPTVISVNVRDRWTLATAAFLAGLALAIGARLINGIVLPRKRLAAFRTGVGPRYQAAFERFEQIDPVQSRGFTSPSGTEIKRFVDDNKSATRRYASTTLVFDMASDAMKAVSEQIADANADADLLAEVGPNGLAAHLGDLADRLATFHAFVDHKFAEHRPKPLLASVIAALGNPNKPTELVVGGVQQLIASVDEGRKALDSWEKSAEQVRRYLRWWQLLRPEVGGDAHDDHETLDAVLDHLRVAASTLVEIGKPADPGFSLADRELSLARGGLSQLGARYDVRVPPDWEQSGTAEPLPFEELLRPVTFAVEEHADDRGGPIKLVGNLFRPDEPAPIGLILAMEAVVLAATAVVAGAIAGRTIYTDDAFGSRSDYLAMLGAGIGSELIATGLLAAMASWRAPVSLPKRST